MRFALALVLVHADQRFEGRGPLDEVLGQLVVGGQAPGHRRDVLVEDGLGRKQALEAFHRAARDVVELERLQVGLRRPSVLAQLALADLAQVQQGRRARRFVAQARLPHEHDRQAVEVLLLLEQTRQLAQGAQVLGLDLDRIL